MTLVDWEIIAGYANPKAEYKALHSDVAVMDVSYLSVVLLTGPERLAVLHKVTTANFDSLADGEGRRTLMLDDQGKLLIDVEVYCMGETLLILAPPTQPADRIISRINRALYFEDVTLRDGGEHVAIFALFGNNMGWLARNIGVDMPKMLSMRRSRVGSVSANVVRSQFLDGAIVAMVREDKAGETWRTLVEAVRALGGLPVGFEAFDTWRVERGITWFGLDYDNTSTPVELGLLPSIDLDKPGKFPGFDAVQKELRDRPLGRVMVGLILDAREAPPPGAPIRAQDGRVVGQLLSVTFSRALNKLAGIALVKNTLSMVNTSLLVVGPDGNCEASVAKLPFASAFETPSEE